MERRRASRLILAGWASCISFLAACSDDPPTQPDGGVSSDAGNFFDRAADGSGSDSLDASRDEPPADSVPFDSMADAFLDPPSADAVSSDSVDASRDAPSSDVGADISHGGDARTPESDADGRCACTPVGDGGIGEQPLACYCASGSRLCPSYDEARTGCPSGAPPQFNRLDIHAACNLVVMTSGGGVGGTTHVFDATTHQLVGVSRVSDTSSFTCGGAPVFGIRAGTFPPTDCPVSRSISRCPADAGPNPEGGVPGDAGCPCSLDDASDIRLGSVALPCYCGSLGSCPFYDDALRVCGNGVPLLSKLDEYPACNLTVITISHGYGARQYAYDYTTRVLVGAMHGGDVPTDSCGSTSVYGYRSGVFPDASCVRARSVACTHDAGAGPADVTTDGD